jgi:ATP-dependent RNA helicase DDX18/HAS1
LDLVKVGKAFGFTVPPRVNITVGSAGGGSNATHSKKRRRTEMEEQDVEMQDIADDKPVESRGNKERRLEQLGQKKLDREIYKIAKDRHLQQQKAIEGGDKRQWSR